MVDSELYDPIHHKDILRCIHIALLCVQELSVDRPTMATVISMLSNEFVLPAPSNSAFIQRQKMMNSTSSEETQRFRSINVVSITEIQGR